MEFRKLRIKDLVPASYNPRKKLKPGDKEFEKIKNSITEEILHGDMLLEGNRHSPTNGGRETVLRW